MSLDPCKPSRQSWECARCARLTQRLPDSAMKRPHTVLIDASTLTPVADRCALLVPIRYRIETPEVVA